MDNLLTWPQQLSNAGTIGANRYELGHEPYFALTVNGKRIINMRAQEAHGMMVATGKPTYDAVVYRADVEGGIGVVPTLKLHFSGREAARMTQEQFPKRAPVVFSAGFADVSGPYQERVLFRGEVSLARQVPMFPVQVVLTCQGLSGRMDQGYDPSLPEQIADPVEFITSRLAKRGLRTNFSRPPANVSVANVSVDELADKRETLLDYVNAFCEAHGLYWTDSGDGSGTILFHFPENRFNYLGQPPINWELRHNGNVREPDIAAPLQRWDIETFFVDAPSKVSFLWRKPNSNVSEKKLVEFPVPGGNSDIPGRVYPVEAKSEAQVRELAKAYIDDVLWQTVSGPWSTGSILIPALTCDFIKATRGPVGMEQIYDRDMIVTRYHHIYDQHGFSSSGNVRGVYTG